MGVDCRKCKSFGSDCDPAEDSYQQPCEEYSFDDTPEQSTLSEVDEWREGV